MTTAESSSNASLELAQSQKDTGAFHLAAATFVRIAAEQPGKRRQMLEEAAACLVRAGAGDDGARLLADAGFIPAGVSFASGASEMVALVAGAALHVIVRVLTRANDLPRAADIALAAWDAGDSTVKESLAFELPGRLINAGRLEDAFRVYHAAWTSALKWGISGRAPIEAH